MGPSPTGTERRLYNIASDLFQTPVVDTPVSVLTSASPLASDLIDNLKPEAKRAEMVLHRAHQAAACSIKASIAASFFTQTFLLWLRQMQMRIHSEDVRSYQNLKKLIAATEFTSDAILNAAKYVSRSIASSVMARRLLWLPHWRADIKSKWKLASAPFKGSSLFGEALDSVLVDTKNRGKTMPPPLFCWDECRYLPYSQKQSFQASEA